MIIIIHDITINTIKTNNKKLILREIKYYYKIQNVVKKFIYSKQNTPITISTIPFQPSIVFLYKHVNRVYSNLG